MFLVYCMRIARFSCSVLDSPSNTGVPFEILRCKRIKKFYYCNTGLCILYAYCKVFQPNTSLPTKESVVFDLMKVRRDYVRNVQSATEMTNLNVKCIKIYNMKTNQKICTAVSNNLYTF